MRSSLLSIAGLLCISHTDAFSTATAPLTRLNPSIGRVSSSAALSAAPSADSSSEERSYQHYNAHPSSSLQQRRQFVIQSIAAGIISTTATLPPFIAPALADDDSTTAAAALEASSIDPSKTLPKITQKVYLDIKFAKYKEPKRLTIGLFGEIMPRTVDNFVALCNSDAEASYKGSSFYRVLSDMSIQGGAISSNGKTPGITSTANGGKPFAPDNYSLQHSVAGLVSAVRSPNGDVDSRFFVQTEEDAGWADGRYAAFGIVLDNDEGGGGGMDLVRRISKVDVKAPQNSPTDPIVIVGCGVL